MTTMKNDLASARPKDFTWYVDGDGEEYVVHSKEFPEYRFRVSSGNEKRDKSLACYAVNAVNNFDALLNALKELALAIDCNEEGGAVNIQYIAEELEHAKTAIANAEK